MKGTYKGRIFFIQTSSKIAPKGKWRHNALIDGSMHRDDHTPTSYRKDSQPEDGVDKAQKNGRKSVCRKHSMTIRKLLITALAVLN